MDEHTCRYSPIEVQCDKSSGPFCDCTTCGWNPKVAEKRKKQARDNIMKKNAHNVFVYAVGGSRP